MRPTSLACKPEYNAGGSFWRHKSRGKKFALYSCKYGRFEPSFDKAAQKAVALLSFTMSFVASFPRLSGFKKVQASRRQCGTAVQIT